MAGTVTPGERTPGERTPGERTPGERTPGERTPGERTPVEVVEYTDVMCSWAWGTEPKLRRLRWEFGERCSWRYVLGGLVGDLTRRDDWDPIGRAPKLSEYWSVVTGHTGAPYPVHLEWVPGSSDPSGVGVCAARLQDPALTGSVLRRLREQVFVFNRPPDTATRVLAALGDIDGLDLDRLDHDLASREGHQAYRADWDETRCPNDYVRNLTGDSLGIGNLKQTDGIERYAFPTLVFRGPGGEHTAPGWLPYEAYVEALEAAEPGSTATPRPLPTPAEAFGTWPLLTQVELDLLCGEDAVLPDGVIAHDWGAGNVYLRPEAYPLLDAG